MVDVGTFTGVTVFPPAVLNVLTYSKGPVIVFGCPPTSTVLLLCAHPQNKAPLPGILRSCLAQSVRLLAARLRRGTATERSASTPAVQTMRTSPRDDFTLVMRSFSRPRDGSRDGPPLPRWTLR